MNAYISQIYITFFALKTRHQFCNVRICRFLVAQLNEFCLELPLFHQLKNNEYKMLYYIVKELPLLKFGQVACGDKY